MDDNYFLEMIQTLRRQQEVILFNNILYINDIHVEPVLDFLQKEYQKELLEYPGYQTTEFNPEAALWAARTVYIAAQLLLFRENKETDLELLLPDYEIKRNGSAVLSIDICLRFLPNILDQLKMIDSEDVIIGILERKLMYWHYSAINYTLPLEGLDFVDMFAENTLKTVYINRIITFKNIELARLDIFKQIIAGYLGIYADNFWGNFNIENK